MTGSPLRIGVIGCGLIGARRAAIAAGHPDSRLVVVADVDHLRAKATAEPAGAAVITDWEQVIERRDVDAVVVSTPHHSLAPISTAALQAGKHVLCEKPMCMNSREGEEVVMVARRSGRVLSVGFNHRHHPAIRRAHQLAREGAVGELLFIRCRYGHGGRPGYEREWRMNPALSGGGELLDQGIHALDLFRWFLGDLCVVASMTANWVWSAPVEDNVFALLRSRRGQVASLHASWTQWKNLFSFELFGDRGAVVVEGLGGSYGAERLSVYRRGHHAGPPTEEQLRFAGPDRSWESEWEAFLAAVRTRQPTVGGEEGLAAIRLVEAVYATAAEARSRATPSPDSPVTARSVETTGLHCRLRREESHDLGTSALAHLARRWRHRSAVVLQQIRRLYRERRHR